MGSKDGKCYWCGRRLDFEVCCETAWLMACQMIAWNKPRTYAADAAVTYTTHQEARDV